MARVLFVPLLPLTSTGRPVLCMRRISCTTAFHLPLSFLCTG